MSTETLRPNAAGDLTEFDVIRADFNWEAVDDVVADDSGTYVQSSTASKIDLYNLSATAIPDGSVINSVTLYSRCVGYAGSHGHIGIKTESVEYWGDALTFGVWTTYTREYTTNPNTNIAWTVTEINALQIGVKAAAANAGMGCTQTYVVIDYNAYTYGALSESAGMRLGGMFKTTANAGRWRW